MKVNFFKGRTDYEHGTKQRVGVLLLNLGTPDAPTKKALKPYLKQFLSDKRVIEIFRPFWLLLLNLIILRTRPKKSAEAYKSIWTEQGSPLLVISKDQRDQIEKKLIDRFGDSVTVSLGMRYGNPSVAKALKELREKECTKIVVLPLYGQYSSATCGSTFDAVVDELKTLRWVPDIRTIMNFHDHPGYINALAKSVTSHWVKNGRAEKLVMSFHGIPKRYMENGDPYHCHCQKTGRLLGEQLGLTRDDYIVTFQSLFGKEEWIKPYTDKSLEYLAKNGTKSVDVICPGFIADCVETLEEIEDENREVFTESGGEKFSYIPALNARSDSIDFFSELIFENTLGWLPIPEYRQVSYKAYEDYQKVAKAQCPFLKK